MKEAMSNPQNGTVLEIVKMNDSRWPKSEGWEKISQKIGDVEIHFVRNKFASLVDDFKFKEIGNYMIISINTKITNEKLYDLKYNYQLDLESKYCVYAISYFSNEIEYLILNKFDKFTFIKDEYTITHSNILPSCWYFVKWERSDGFCGYYWGFKELIENDDYAEQLYDRTPFAINALMKEKMRLATPIEQYDTVILTTDLSGNNIPAGLIGMVTSRPDYENFLYPVTFYRHDGSEYPEVVVPREYLKRE